MYLEANLEKPEGEWWQLAKPGNFYHPRTKKKFTLELSQFESWVSYFDYLKQQGNTIPVVPQHSLNPSERLGSIEELKLIDGIPYAKLSFDREEDKERMKNASVSVFFQNDYMEHDATEFKSALLHVGVTDYPVLKGLQKTIAASVFSESEFLQLGYIIEDDNNNPPEHTPETPNPQEENMEKIAKILGLSATATEDEIVGVLEKTGQELSSLKEEVKKIREAETARNHARIEKLSVSDEQKTQLKELDTKSLDIALSFISTNDQNFQTGGQGSDDEDSASLLSSMEEYAKETNEGGLL